jgi:hypothetical protein
MAFFNSIYDFGICVVDIDFQIRFGQCVFRPRGRTQLQIGHSPITHRNAFASIEWNRNKR